MKPFDLEKSNLEAKIIDLEINNTLLKDNVNTLKQKLYEAKIKINSLEKEKK